MPLGQHLRAHQHIHVTAVRMRQLLRQATRLPGSVGIHAQHAQRRAVRAQRSVQLLLQGFFQLFGAQPQCAHVLIAACGASARHRHGVAAMVTTQGTVDFVIHAKRAAMRALAFPVAIRTMQHGGITPTVKQQQALLATRRALLHGLE